MIKRFLVGGAGLICVGSLSYIGYLDNKYGIMDPVEIGKCTFHGGKYAYIEFYGEITNHPHLY